MFQFFKKKNGTITVAVTLLLIPSLIVTGTAVDVARVHAAKSMIEDANLLAANALLTEYNTMLQDVYGIYAVMEDDPVLGTMLDEYIQVAILGEEYVSNDLGTFQVFNGSTISSTTGSYVSNKNLADVDVLRRQIEEYAKFRAPIIAIEEIWNKLESFEKTAADSEIIIQKTEIESDLGELNDDYVSLRTTISEITGFDAKNQAYITKINVAITKIKEQFFKMDSVRQEYMYECRLGVYDEDKIADLKLHYEGEKANVETAINGGDIQGGWVDGYVTDDGFVSGEYEIKSDDKLDGILAILEEYKGFLQEYESDLSALVTKSKAVDQKRDAIANDVDDFEADLNSGECSEALTTGMTEPTGSATTSTLDAYRACLEYDAEPLATAFQEANLPFIQEMQELLDVMDNGYGDVLSNELTGDIFVYSEIEFLTIEKDITYPVGETPYAPSDNTSDDYIDDLLFYFASLQLYTYKVEVGWQEYTSISTEHLTFMSMLNQLTSSSSSSSDTSDEEDSVKSAYSTIKEEFDKIVDTATMDNEGAKYYTTIAMPDISGYSSVVDAVEALVQYEKDRLEESGGETETDSTLETDWSDDGDSKVTEALGNSKVSELANLADSFGNKLLLLVYAKEMFSHFATNKGLEDDEAREVSMSGEEFNTANNYFYQAELEYIYGGNSYDVRDNIASVYGLILMIQLVSNFVMTYVISEVNAEITGIGALGGPFAFLVTGIARCVFALGESLIDLKNLTNGESVPLIKTDKTWSFSLKNLACLAGGATKPEEGVLSLEYEDYLGLFLLMVDGDTMAERVSNLIGWNMTNRLENINADEEKMTAATQFKMSQAHTDFVVTTTVDFRMIFLSMDMFQSFSDTTQPPGTIPITVTSYRGY